MSGSSTNTPTAQRLNSPEKPSRLTQTEASPLRKSRNEPVLRWQRIPSSPSSEPRYLLSFIHAQQPLQLLNVVCRLRFERYELNTGRLHDPLNLMPPRSVAFSSQGIRFKLHYLFDHSRPWLH